MSTGALCTEGVPSNHGRRSRDGRLWWLGGKSWPARTVTPVRLSHGRQRELAGVRETRPTGHDSKRELDGEKEESKTSSPRAKIGGGDEARMADHGEQRTTAFYKE